MKRCARRAVPVAFRCGLVALAAALLTTACGGSASSSSSKRTSNSSQAQAGAPIDLCAGLSVADLRAQGLAPELDNPLESGLPLDNGDTGAMCRWTKQYGLLGGIEQDVYYPVGNPEQVELGYPSGISGTLQPSGLRGAGASRIGLSMVAIPGHTCALITVRRGRLVFALAIPPGPRAHDQLMSLAATAMAKLPS